MKKLITPAVSLFAALAGFVLTASASDVDFYLAAKGQNYAQTNAGAPFILTSESPFGFAAEVLAASTNGVTNAVIKLPSRLLLPLTNAADETAPADFAFSAGFTNKTQLDAKYAAGAYVFAIHTLNDGSNSATLTLPREAYPVAPRIANWDDAQQIESELPFVLRWDAITNAGAGDLVVLGINQTNGEPVLSSPSYLQPGALNGRDVAVVIPASTLAAGRTYDAQLLVLKVGALNTNALAGATGVGGYYRQTRFPLATLPEAGGMSRVQFSAQAYSANEADGSATVTVTRVGDENDSVSVNLVTSDGTAVNGVNYSGVSTTLNFGPGVTSADVVIPLHDDFKYTGNRTVNLALSGLAGNAYLGSRAQSVLTIVDAQKAAAGQVQFSTTTYNKVAETVGTLKVTVARVGGSAGAVGAHFYTMNGTAQAGINYVATNGTLLIPAGKTSATLSIPILNNSLNETNKNFFIVLDGTSGGAALGTNRMATVNLLDNDPGGAITLASAAYTTNENAGAFLVTVKRAAVGTLASGVTVDFTTADGSAQAGLDYVATNGTLTFGSNELTKVVSVPLINDTLPEGNETLFFHLANPAGGGTLGLVTNATLTIKDDESSVSFSNATYTVSEAGRSVVLSVVRSGALLTPVSVDFATADGTAVAGLDYTATNGTLSFPANTPVKTITIPIKEDTLVEGDEIFSVRLTNPQNGLQLGAVADATVTIVDNDAGGSIGFATNSYAVSESGTNAVITLVRSNGLASAVTVNFITTAGTATAGVDYSNATQTVTFNAGETTRKILVPIISDALVEGNETVQLTLADATGGATLGARASATLTIVDDDFGGVIQFQSPTYSANENATNFVINVLRTGGKAGGVSVPFHTQPGTATEADFVAANGVLEFAAGETNKTIRVGIINDVLAEGNEQFSLVLDPPSGGASLGANTRATLTIVDDESSISLGSANIAVSEAGTNVAVTLVRSGALLTGVAVDFATVNGTATAGADYTATNGTLVFPANTGTKTVLIPVINDTVAEGNETFNFRIFNPQGGVQLGTVTNTTVTIVDDDFPGVIQFSSAAYSGAEGSNAVITLTRTGGKAGGVSVYFQMTPGTATAGVDYANVSGTVSFAAGETSKNILVPIVQDTLAEPAETVLLSLSSPQGGATLGTPQNATLSILDKPDPNAVPLTGPLFTKGTVRGVAYSQLSANSCIASSNPNSVLQITVSWITGSGMSTVSHLMTVDVFPRTLGALAMNNDGSHGLATYTEGQFNGVGHTWAVADGSASPGSYGTFTLDAIDYTAKLASGRFTLHMKETTDGVVNPGFIDVTGSFRVALVP